MNTSAAGIALIKESEALRLTAYFDSEGVPTIGWGHTLNVVKADVGVKTITEAEAETLFLVDDLPRYEAAVNVVVKVPINQGQYDALVDFAFNLGGGALANSTLLRKLNRGDTEGAAQEFARWVHGVGGDILPGLVTRRAAERALFLGA